MFKATKAVKLAMFGAALLALASVASAQPLHLEPGSLLIFPLYDSTAGAGTVICVTNTNDSNIYCPDSDFREGDIVLHYVYVDGETCFEFDRYEILTPGDTLCVLADNHNPEQDLGYLVVRAVDPSDYDRMVKFDYLIGSAITVQADLNFFWSYTPYAFRGWPAIEQSVDDACARQGTDENGDGDGASDFDGTEYDLFPRTLYLDSFFEETDPFGNQLTLMTTAGQDYIAEVNFLFWNNIEEKYSRTLKFTCWWNGSLSDISNVVTDLMGDETELGHNDVQLGWASINGNRVLDLAGNPVLADDEDNLIPPLLGVYADFISATDFAGGHALHFSGTLDGLEILNGDGDLVQ